MALRLVPDDTKFDFIGKRFIAFLFSMVLIVGSIICVSTQGLNFGIDFTGGTLVEIKTDGPADLSDLRKRVGGLGFGEVNIQEFGEPDEVMIRLQQQVGGQGAQEIVMEKLRGALPESVEYRRVEFVGPQVGDELITAGMKAIVFSLIGILIYIWIRFEWQFGVAAVVALAHDAILTVGFFALTQLEFTLATVAAVLTIAGYSINDTVVVFDRVRETLRKYRKLPLPDLFNLAINSTLARTLMTSVTTMLALIALWFFGGAVIQGFITALIFGVVIGTYSSIFVATPMLLYMRLERPGAAAVRSSSATA